RRLCPWLCRAVRLRGIPVQDHRLLCARARTVDCMERSCTGYPVANPGRACALQQRRQRGNTATHRIVRLMQQFSVTPKEMIASLWRNRSLINALVKREVIGRYRGSFMGILWSFFNPVFMLAVYTVVFSIVFQARWGTGNGSKTEFALILFAGLIVFNIFAECVNRAPTLILSNVNYVKK